MFLCFCSQQKINIGKINIELLYDKYMLCFISAAFVASDFAKAPQTYHVVDFTQSLPPHLFFCSIFSAKAPGPHALRVTPPPLAIDGIRMNGKVHRKVGNVLRAYSNTQPSIFSALNHDVKKRINLSIGESRDFVDRTNSFFKLPSFNGMQILVIGWMDDA